MNSALTLKSVVVNLLSYKNKPYRRNRPFALKSPPNAESPTESYPISILILDSKARFGIDFTTQTGMGQPMILGQLASIDMKYA